MATKKTDALLVAAHGVADALQAFDAAAAALADDEMKEFSHSVAAGCAIVECAEKLKGAGVYLYEGSSFTADEFVQWVTESAEVIERLTAEEVAA